MKNIYIGDIHGSDAWKRIVEEHGDADNIVFIGDYLDTYEDISGTQQLRNLEEIVEFKELQELDPTKKVYLLIGNHDIHYMSGNQDYGGTSGYQVVMRPSYEMFFYENKQHFQLCVVLGNRMCTHAGVSDVFLQDTGYYTYNDKTIEDFLNELFVHKINEFIYAAPYDRGYRHLNGYGEDVFQGPLWIRPKFLQRANKKTDLKKNYIQIVGHTKQPRLDLSGKTTGGKYIYIDTIPVGEYLIEIDGEFSVGKI